MVFDLTARLGGTKAAVRNARKVLALHELGHAVGLGHVKDSRQIMAQDSDPQGPLRTRGPSRAGPSRRRRGVRPGAPPCVPLS